MRKVLKYEGKNGGKVEEHKGDRIKGGIGVRNRRNRRMKRRRKEKL